MGRKIGSSLKGGGVFALSGDLGSGKTTFIQGFAKGLGIKSKIISPTFILMRTYKGIRQLTLCHLDLYRLEGDVEEEVKNLGLEEIWDDPKNIVVIEWAEKIKSILPKNTKWIRFSNPLRGENLGEDTRKVVI